MSPSHSTPPSVTPNDLGHDATVFILRGWNWAAEAKRLEQSEEDRIGTAKGEEEEKEDEERLSDGEEVVEAAVVVA